MGARSLLAAGRVAGESGARLTELRRIIRLETEVAALRAERARLREDFAIARSWIRDLMRCIEATDADAPRAVPGLDCAPRRSSSPLPWRRLAAVTPLAAPWAVIGAALAAGLGLI